MTSATTAMAGSSRIAAKSVVSTPSVLKESRRRAGIPDERPNDPKPVPRCTLDVVGAVLEQPVHGRADTAVAEERDRDVDRIKGRSHRTSLGGWRRTCQRNCRNPNRAVTRSRDRSFGANRLALRRRQGETAEWRIGLTSLLGAQGAKVCLACGGPIEETLMWVGSLRCLECRDIHRPLDPLLAKPPEKTAGPVHGADDAPRAAPRASFGPSSRLIHAAARVRPGCRPHGGPEKPRFADGATPGRAHDIPRSRRGSADEIDSRSESASHPALRR